MKKHRFRFLIVAVAVSMISHATSAVRAHAQGMADYDYTNLSFRGAGFAYGRIWPSKVEPANTYTLRVDLGYLGPAIRIAPTFTYWTSQLRDRELDELARKLEQLPPLQADGVQLSGSDLGPIKWSDLSLGIDAHVVWTAPFRTLTYIGGGVALHALNGRGDAIANTFIEDLLDTTTPGFAIMGGLENQPITRLRIFAEARYTTLSDVHYPELRVGGALMWPGTSQTATQGGR
jgi:opacity protein-like surface antigen